MKLLSGVSPFFGLEDDGALDLLWILLTFLIVLPLLLAVVTSGTAGAEMSRAPAVTSGTAGDEMSTAPGVTTESDDLSLTLRDSRMDPRIFDPGQYFGSVVMVRLKGNPLPQHMSSRPSTNF